MRCAILCCALLIVEADAMAANGNLLRNPGFESAGTGLPDNWSAWGEGAVSTVADGAHGGSAAVQLDGKAGGQGIYQFTEGAIVGAEYEGSFWVRAESGDVVEVGVKLEFQNAADGKMQSQWSLRAGRAWKRFSYRAVAPPETLRAGLTLVVSPGAVVRIDDAALAVFGKPRPAGAVGYDLMKFSGTVAGWGVHHWASNKKAAQEFAALNITHIRIAKDGDSWEDLMELHRLTDRLGIKWLFVKWSPPGEMMGADGQLNDVPGFTREWIATLKDLDAHGCRPHFIDLSNEPDYFGIKPETYVALVKSVRAALDTNGFKEIGIAGPGLTHVGADNFGRYDRAIDDEAMPSLAVWATHAWEDTWDDRSGNSAVTPTRARAFVERCRERDAAKPVWYTEYATAARRFHGVMYPDSDTESENYCGSFTQAFAARTFENTLQILNHGADMAFYWCSEDFPDSKKQWGYIGPTGGRKNIYWALHALYGNLKPGTRVVQAPEWRPGAPVTGVFVNGATILVAAVNTADKEMSGTIRLDHAPRGLAVVRSESFTWKRAGDVTQRRPDEIVPGPRAVKLSAARSSVELRYALPADGWACWVLSVPER
jgi:hypothetical protein